MKVTKVIGKTAICILFFLLIFSGCSLNESSSIDTGLMDTPVNRAVSTTELIGYGAGTTGGAGGSTVTVSSYTDFATYASDTTTRIIEFSGTLSSTGMLSINSNKTIRGTGTNATISGFGLNISGKKNIIIQNITFTNANDDSVNIQESSTYIWITHCNFTNGYDGLLDIKRKSSYITVSWNKFYNHDKTCLLGHSDDYDDTGYLKVTYHHNWFNGTVQRHPRVRWGNVVHIFNNLYENNSGYGVASTCNAGVLVEGCYFSNVSRPFSLSEGGSPEGNLNERNNVFTGCGSIVTKGSVSNPPYSYPIDNANDIPAIVKAYAGVTGSTTVDTPAPTSIPTSTPAATIASTTTPSATTAPSETTPPSTGCTCTNLCSSQTSISAPFTFDGAGEYCWVSSSLGSYVNSWNTDAVNINGTNYTNTYVLSSSVPANGGVYYIYYKGSYSWSHIEIK